VSATASRAEADIRFFLKDDLDFGDRANCIGKQMAPDVARNVACDFALVAECHVSWGTKAARFAPLQRDRASTPVPKGLAKRNTTRVNARVCSRTTRKEDGTKELETRT
jgi:hypothetical protein